MEFLDLEPRENGSLVFEMVALDAATNPKEGKEEAYVDDQCDVVVLLSFFATREVIDLDT